AAFRLVTALIASFAFESSVGCRILSVSFGLFNVPPPLYSSSLYISQASLYPTQLSTPHASKHERKSESSSNRSYSALLIVTFSYILIAPLSEIHPLIEIRYFFEVVVRPVFETLVVAVVMFRSVVVVAFRSNSATLYASWFVHRTSTLLSTGATSSTHFVSPAYPSPNLKLEPITSDVISAKEPSG